MAQDPWTLNWAEVQQAHIVAALITALLGELSGGTGGDSVATPIDVVADLLAAPADFAALLATDQQGQSVAVLTLSQCSAIYAGGRFGEIAEFYVDPTCRSGGLGARMIAEAIAEARRRGWPRLEVGAPDQPTWQRTLDFYHRNGFSDVGPRLKLILS